MRHKKSTIIATLTFFCLCGAFADIITWRAHAGQQYEAKVTLKESVIGLDSVTSKPVTVTVNVYKQEDAAKNQSTIAHLSSLPSFPRKSVEVGSTWTLPAKIRYDFSAFGMTDLFVLETPVTYRLRSIVVIDGRSYYDIRAEWFPFHAFDKKTASRIGINRISGSCSMDILWDNRSGSPKKNALLEETQYQFADASSLLFRREISEEFKTVTDLVRERIIRQLTEGIATQKVANVEVRQSDEGVVLSVENIQFAADSATLADGERSKLTNIAKVLSSLKDRKIHVIGHAANVAGSLEEELRSLSAARAVTVADFLVTAGGRNPSSVLSSGMGGAKPLASNDTVEGRMKNRRVEIVILDKEASE